MDKRIFELAEQSDLDVHKHWSDDGGNRLAVFAKLIAQECVNKIETYKIYRRPSVAGERAAEWTYEALKEIRQQIWDEFGMEGNG